MPSHGWIFLAFTSYLNFMKVTFLGFHVVASTCEDLSIDVSITNVELILTKLWWFLFSGYGQTDRVLESSHGNITCRHTKKFSTQSSKFVVSCRSLYASLEDGDAQLVGAEYSVSVVTRDRKGSGELVKLAYWGGAFFHFFQNHSSHSVEKLLNDVIMRSWKF